MRTGAHTHIGCTGFGEDTYFESYFLEIQYIEGNDQASLCANVFNVGKARPWRHGSKANALHCGLCIICGFLFGKAHTSFL